MTTVTGYYVRVRRSEPSGSSMVVTLVDEDEKVLSSTIIPDDGPRTDEWVRVTFPEPVDIEAARKFDLRLSRKP